MAYEINDLFKKMFDQNASDLHLNAGMPPIIRVDGALKNLGDTPLEGKDIEDLCFPLLDKKQVDEFKKERELDLSLNIDGVSRFRANLFWKLDTVAAAFRSIPFKIPKPEDLGLPEVTLQFADLPHGLVLVTGPTGSGKTTTLASLINRINQNRAEHIITVEDPIEYVYTQKKSLISQREVGRDTLTFSNSLKYILRQDPNVVLVGEMRDLETISHTITAAETGHLVFATLHTNSAMETVDRIIDVFPPHQQPQVRTQLSLILQGVLTQKLLPKIAGGRALAMEVMIPNSAIRNLIREGKTHQISAQMQMGREQTKMMTMDMALAQLVKKGVVSREVAAQKANDLIVFNDSLR